MNQAQEGSKMAKVVVVTSGKGGVGKTTSTAALGTALAQGGRRPLSWILTSACATSTCLGRTGVPAADPAHRQITLNELAGEFGVSRERVRQIEARSVEKLQKAVTKCLAAMESLAALPVE
jgi:coenzyme F420-reducing hydrogenase delta subunit